MISGAKRFFCVKSKLNEETSPRFGIADGGHTFKVIENVVADLESYKADDSWMVKRHLEAGIGGRQFDRGPGAGAGKMSAGRVGAGWKNEEAEGDQQ